MEYYPPLREFQILTKVGLIYLSVSLLLYIMVRKLSSLQPISYIGVGGCGDAGIGRHFF